MRHAEYELAGNIPAALLGREIEVKDKDGNTVTKRVPFTVQTKEAETLEEFHTLVQDGKPENVLKLAQSAWDIIVQRVIRTAAGSETVKGILEGSSEVEVNGEKLDFSHATDDERIEHAIKYCQDAADAYVYGARGPATGGASAITKAKAQNMDRIAQAAAANPDLAAQLASLGITL